MIYEDFININANNRIHVVQEIPSKGAHFPMIVMVSGFGADYHEFGLFDILNDAFIQHGFGVIRFSFVGIGKSSGDYSTTTLDDLVAQFKRVIDYTIHDRFVDRRNIGLFAHGFGAAVLFSSSPIEYFKSLALSAPMSEPDEALPRLFRRQRGYYPDAVSTRESPDNTKIRVGSQFWPSLTTQKIKQGITLLTIPTLIIHGEKDKNIKVYKSVDLYESLMCRKKFVLLDKADHAFTGDFRQPFIDQVCLWFNETLRTEDNTIA